MKSHRSLAFFVAVILGITPTLVAQSDECELSTVIISEDKPVNWNLPKVIVFSDNFNGKSLDQNLWGFGFPWGKMLNEEALEGMAEENLSLQNGKLILKTEYRERDFDRFIFNENGELTGTEPVKKNFSSAGIFSKIEFIGGDFELEYEIDEITAQWPAFWLLGDCQQEVDIFEYFYGKSIFHSNWTKEITYTLHLDKNCNTPKKCILVKTKFLDDQFYENELFSKLSWEMHRLRFYSTPSEPDYIHYRWRDFGNRPIAYPNKGQVLNQSSFFPFDKPMRLLIGQGVHKNIGHRLKNNPKYLKLNELTVWQILDPSGKHKLDLNYPYQDQYDGIITGGEVSIKDSSPFYYKPYLIVRAASDIELEPGFDSGGNLTDLVVVPQSEFRYSNEKHGKNLIPQFIVKMEFYDFQGVSILQIDGLQNPMHEKELLIKKALNNNPTLKGLTILRVLYSDGSWATEKLGLMR